MGAEDMLAQWDRYRASEVYRQPWRYPDRPDWPTFVVSPAADHAAAVLTLVQDAATEARRRVRAAWTALRWGAPDVEDWD